MFAESSCPPSPLSILILLHVQVSDPDLYVLAAFAHNFAALQSLSLAQSNVSRDGIMVVLGIPSLTSLDISKCRSLSDDDFGAIGKELLSSTANKLGVLKCDAFEVPLGVSSLKFFNESTGVGATALLFGVIKSNASLTKLDLSRNAMGDKGAIALSNALKVNTSLSEVLASRRVRVMVSVALSPPPHMHSIVCCFVPWCAGSS